MKASAEEFQRVRESECEVTGHEAEVMMVVGDAGPDSVVCKRCGAAWGVGERIIGRQVIGYLRGRAMAIEDEAANAPDAALPTMATRAAAYRTASDYLDTEEL